MHTPFINTHIETVWNIQKISNRNIATLLYLSYQIHLKHTKVTIDVHFVVTVLIFIQHTKFRAKMESRICSCRSELCTSSTPIQQVFGFNRSYWICALEIKFLRKMHSHPKHRQSTCHLQRTDFQRILRASPAPAKSNSKHEKKKWKRKIRTWNTKLCQTFKESLTRESGWNIFFLFLSWHRFVHRQFKRWQRKC